MYAQQRPHVQIISASTLRQSRNLLRRYDSSDIPINVAYYLNASVAPNTSASLHRLHSYCKVPNKRLWMILRLVFDIVLLEIRDPGGKGGGAEGEGRKGREQVICFRNLQATLHGAYHYS